jgi:hypothetical protein
MGKTVLIIGLLGAVASLGVMYIQKDKDFNEGPEIKKTIVYAREGKVVEAREGINNIAQKLGWQESYSLFKKELEGDYSSGHATLHLFGEELYESQGNEGVSICDQSFGFGCVHGFSTRALSENGASVLLDLEKVCNTYPDNTLGCIHGLGHGAYEYFGFKNMLKALDACSMTSWKGKIHGCADGIFMEYNFPSISNATSKEQTTRQMDQGNPYDICPTLPQGYRRSCFYSLGQWWGSLMDKDYEKMGKLCEPVEDYYDRRACFLGIGNTIPIDVNFVPNESVKDIAQNCSKMPSPDGEAMCRTAVFMILSSKEHKKEYAEDACKGLPPALEKSCLDHSLVDEVQFGPDPKPTQARNNKQS